MNQNNLEQYCGMMVNMLDEGLPNNIVITEIVTALEKDIANRHKNSRARTREERNKKSTIYDTILSGKITVDLFNAFMKHYDHFVYILNDALHEAEQLVMLEDEWDEMPADIYELDLASDFMRRVSYEYPLIGRKLSNYVPPIQLVRSELDSKMRDEYKDKKPTKRTKVSYYDIACAMYCEYVWEPSNGIGAPAMSRMEYFQRMCSSDANAFSQSSFYRIAHDYLPWFMQQVNSKMTPDQQYHLKTMAIIAKNVSHLPDYKLIFDIILEQDKDDPSSGQPDILEMLHSKNRHGGN